MRWLNRCFVIIFLLFIQMNSVTEILAMNTGFSTDYLTDKDKSVFFNNVNISLVSEEPIKRAIECFDVNEDGMIALGQKASDEKVLCVYSQDGSFEYGYTFNCSGTFGVEWNNDDINIYFTRSDVIITVNRTGEITDILKVQNTTENNYYLNHFIYSSNRIQNNVKYTLKNDIGILNIFTSSYSQLIVTKTNGEEFVLYDVNSSQFTNVLAIFIVFVIFLLVAIILIIRQFIILRRNMMK